MDNSGSLWKSLNMPISSNLSILSQVSERNTEIRLDVVMRIHSIIITILSPVILERTETIAHLGWSVLEREGSLEGRKEREEESNAIVAKKCNY